MKYKSAVIASGSGSLNGCVFSHNRYGSYIRNRSVPVNPNSPTQQSVRTFFADAATAWAAVLTPAQRQAWNTYAANVPRIGPLGETQYTTGLNWFLAVNVMRRQVAGGLLAVAPIIFTMASLQDAFVSDASDTPDADITHLITEDWAKVVGGYLHVYLSPPQNPSINFFKAPFRYVTSIAGAVIPPPSPTTVLSPFPYATGQKIWARLVAQNADGRFSPPIVTAVLVS